MLKPPVEIMLYLNSVEELFNKNASFFHNYKLNKEAEGFIIERASALSRKTSIILKIHLPLNEISKSEEIITAIHQHSFCFLQTKIGEAAKEHIAIGLEKSAHSNRIS